MINVRLANENELERINELRKEVNELHVQGKPEVFKPGFSDELKDYIRVIWEDPEKDIAVAEQGGVLCGFAVLHRMHKPETPFMFAREYLDVDEFGVGEPYRRQGVATALIGFIRAYAKEKDLHRIELNMWEFNSGALAFYEAAGFQTYRRYMELFLEDTK